MRTNVSSTLKLTMVGLLLVFAAVLPSPAMAENQSSPEPISFEEISQAAEDCRVVQVVSTLQNASFDELLCLTESQFNRLQLLAGANSPEVLYDTICQVVLDREYIGQVELVDCEANHMQSRFAVNDAQYPAPGAILAMMLAGTSERGGGYSPAFETALLNANLCPDLPATPTYVCGVTLPGSTDGIVENENINKVTTAAMQFVGQIEVCDIENENSCGTGVPLRRLLETLELLEVIGNCSVDSDLGDVCGFHLGVDPCDFSVPQTDAALCSGGLPCVDQTNTEPVVVCGVPVPTTIVGDILDQIVLPDVCAGGIQKGSVCGFVVPNDPCTILVADSNELIPACGGELPCVANTNVPAKTICGITVDTNPCSYIPTSYRKAVPGCGGNTPCVDETSIPNREVCGFVIPTDICAFMEDQNIELMDDPLCGPPHQCEGESLEIPIPDGLLIRLETVCIPTVCSTTTSALALVPGDKAENPACNDGECDGNWETIPSPVPSDSARYCVPDYCVFDDSETLAYGPQHVIPGCVGEGACPGNEVELPALLGREVGPACLPNYCDYAPDGDEFGLGFVDEIMRICGQQDPCSGIELLLPTQRYLPNARVTTLCIPSYCAVQPQEILGLADGRIASLPGCYQPIDCPGESVVLPDTINEHDVQVCVPDYCTYDPPVPVGTPDINRDFLPGCSDPEPCDGEEYVVPIPDPVVADIESICLPPICERLQTGNDFVVPGCERVDPCSGSELTIQSPDEVPDSYKPEPICIPSPCAELDDGTLYGISDIEMPAEPLPVAIQPKCEVPDPCLIIDVEYVGPHPCGRPSELIDCSSDWLSFANVACVTYTYNGQELSVPLNMPGIFFKDEKTTSEKTERFTEFMNCHARSILGELQPPCPEPTPEILAIRENDIEAIAWFVGGVILAPWQPECDEPGSGTECILREECTDSPSVEDCLRPAGIFGSFITTPLENSQLATDGANPLFAGNYESTVSMAGASFGTTSNNLVPTSLSGAVLIDAPVSVFDLGEPEGDQQKSYEPKVIEATLTFATPYFSGESLFVDKTRAGGIVGIGDNQVKLVQENVKGIVAVGTPVDSPDDANKVLQWSLDAKAEFDVLLPDPFGHERDLGLGTLLKLDWETSAATSDVEFSIGSIGLLVEPFPQVLSGATIGLGGDPKKGRSITTVQWPSNTDADEIKVFFDDEPVFDFNNPPMIFDLKVIQEETKDLGEENQMSLNINFRGQRSPTDGRTSQISKELGPGTVVANGINDHFALHVIYETGRESKIPGLFIDASVPEGQDNPLIAKVSYSSPELYISAEEINQVTIDLRGIEDMNSGATVDASLGNGGRIDLELGSQAQDMDLQLTGDLGDVSMKVAVVPEIMLFEYSSTPEFGLNPGSHIKWNRDGQVVLDARGLLNARVKTNDVGDFDRTDVLAEFLDGYFHMVASHIGVGKIDSDDVSDHLKFNHIELLHLNTSMHAPEQGAVVEKEHDVNISWRMTGEGFMDLRLKFYLIKSHVERINGESFDMLDVRKDGGSAGCWTFDIKLNKNGDYAARCRGFNDDVFEFWTLGPDVAYEYLVKKANHEIEQF